MTPIELRAAGLINDDEFNSLQHGDRGYVDRVTEPKGYIKLNGGLPAKRITDNRNYRTVEAAADAAGKSIVTLVRRNPEKVYPRFWEAGVKINNQQYTLYFDLGQFGDIEWDRSKWQGEKKVSGGKVALTDR